MTDHCTWAIVPVKRFDHAKLRLAPLLSALQRAALAKAMLEDLIDALADVPEIDVLCIVSDEPSLTAAAHVLLHDPLDATLSDVVQHAVKVAAERGADTCCILHADLPLLSSGSVSRLLREHRSAGGAAATLVADRERRGTNAIVCTAANPLDFCYGRGSLAAHCSAAERMGAPARVVLDDALALDIDTPEDLRNLRLHAAAAGTRTRAFLSGFAAECASCHGA